MKFAIFPKRNQPIKRGYYIACAVLLCIAIGLCIATLVVNSHIINALNSSPYSVDATVVSTKFMPSGDYSFVLEFTDSYQEDHSIRVTGSLSNFPELGDITSGSTEKIYYKCDQYLIPDPATVFFERSLLDYRIMTFSWIFCFILFIAYTVIVVAARIHFRNYGYKARTKPKKR